MKRILAAVLGILYMASVSGATLHLHYCMGKLASASFNHFQDDHFCHVCGMKKSSNKKGCCKDETRRIKGTDQHKASSINPDFKYTDLTAIPSYIIPGENAGRYCAPVRNSVPIHAPPDFRHNCPLFLEVRNIRI